MILPRRRQTGISLVEMMIAMAIGLFLTLGIFSMFTLSSTNVVNTSQLNQLQENGRFALSILIEEISQAGFFGDITGTALITGINIENLDPINRHDDCYSAFANNGSIPSDPIIDPSTAIPFKFLYSYTPDHKNQLSCLSSLQITSDVLQIKRVIGPAIDNITEKNRYYLATTPNAGTFFKGDRMPPKLENGRYWQYKHSVYFIEKDSNGIPSLKRKMLTAKGMKNNEQLVQGIEYLKIYFGFDTDNNGIVDNYISANSAVINRNNIDQNQLLAVRLYILVKSVEPDPKYINKNRYQLGNHVINDKPFNDHYRRKVISSTVILENPVMINH